MRMSKKKRSGAGFTLVELIVVIVIILILAAVLVPQLLKYVDRANQAKCANQRHELANEFQIMGTEVSGLGECTTADAVKVLLGMDTIQYMIDHHFAQADAVECPVYHDRYTLDVTWNGNKQNVSFICQCVKNLNSYRTGFESYYAALKPGEGDKAAMEKYLADHPDGFMKVSPSMTAGTAYAKESLYWRPHHLSDGTLVLYAGKDNYSKNENGDLKNVEAQWRACLLYVNGALYESTKTGEKPPGTGITDIHKFTADKVIENINKGVEQYATFKPVK